MLLGALLLSVASILYSIARLEFHTSQDELISPDSRDSRNYLRYVKEFPDLDGLVVVVRAEPAPARAELFADALAGRLARDPVNVKSVFYKIDPGMFADRALLYLNSGDLGELAMRLRQSQALLAGWAVDPSLANFFKLVNHRAGRAMVSKMPAGFLAARDDPSSDGASRTLDLSLVDSVLGGMLAGKVEHLDSPWERLTRPDEPNALRDGYLFSDNGRYLLLHIALGRGAEHGPDPVDAIEAHLDAVRSVFPDVEAGMTGGPALAHAEETATAHDMALASVIAIASNLLLIILPFRGLVEPMFAVAALLAGVAWSFGFTTLAVGHLNLLSAVFTSVLAGVGINFPIHLMARYDEARRRGRAMEEAIELAVVNTGAGVTASACIMALAFLMPSFTDFRGIAELGLISAAGLSLCLISAMLVFPALLALRDRKRLPHDATAARLAPPGSGLGALFQKPGTILGLSSAVTMAALILMGRVGFDQNLLKLQAEQTEAVTFENKLLKDSGRSSWFAVALAPDRAAADREAAAFRKLPQVSASETISSYIPESQASKRTALLALKALVDSIQVQRPRSSDRALIRELGDLDFKLARAGGVDPPAALGTTERMIREVIARLRLDPSAFSGYERWMADDLSAKLESFKRELSPGPVTEKNLPAVLRARFIASSGNYLVQIYPRGDIWGDAPLERFVTALRSVDRDVTGPPVQTYSIASVMRRGYERAAALALIAVFLFVFADFRSLRDASLAAVPLLFGGAWLLEAMGALGWEFNLANLFAVPIIIGTGVDNGVNILYRWREERNKSQLILSRAVGKSVTISSLTTIAGFAALIPATHRGISSLGWVLSLGVTLILIATLFVLPALLVSIGRRIDRAQSAEPKAEFPLGRSAAVGVIAIVMAGVTAFATVSQARTSHRSSKPPSGDQAASARLVDEAERMIKAAGQSDPLDSAKVRAAIEKLKRATELDPSNDAAYVDLGFAYGLLKEPSTAVDMYRAAAKINPSPANFKELADIYLRVGSPGEALMAANAGLLKDQRDAGLYNARGMALTDLERFEEAARDFRKALEIDPSLTAAQVNLDALGADKTGRSTVSKRKAEPR